MRDIEALIHANSSVMELGADGRNAHQLALSRGSLSIGKWFEPMWPMWYGGHNPNKRYHRAAKNFLNCCRWSRGREGMHPDDWCIPRHDAYRVLTFLGPELAGLWPGPPKGYRGYVPGPSWRRPVVVVERVSVGGAAAGGAAVVCAHCGVASAKLLRCGRCKTAQYCGSKCQAKHYPAHKVACRAIAAAAAVAVQGKDA